MTNKDVMARLKKQSSSFKKKSERKDEVTHVSLAKLIPDEYIEGEYDLTQDKETNSFLRLKAAEIKNVEAASRIELGKVLNEVYKKLSGKNQYDGLYEKWLEEVDLNKRTALRYRKRYEIYSQVENENGKKLVASLPERTMERLFNHDKYPLIILEINKGIEKEGLNNLLEEVTHMSPAMVIHEKPVVPFYRPVFAFEKKIAKMDEQEKAKAKEEIKAIIEEARRLEKILEAE